MSLIRSRFTNPCKNWTYVRYFWTRPIGPSPLTALVIVMVGVTYKPIRSLSHFWSLHILGQTNPSSKMLHGNMIYQAHLRLGKFSSTHAPPCEHTSGPSPKARRLEFHWIQHDGQHRLMRNLTPLINLTQSHSHSQPLINCHWPTLTWIIRTISTVIKKTHIKAPLDFSAHKTMG